MWIALGLALLGSGTATDPAPQSSGPAADLAAELFRDVEAIAAPGTPGDVVAFGPNTWVPLVDAKGTPIVAAGEFGKGRVLLLGHGGYLGGEALAKADTAGFMKNALRWLSGGKRKPKVLFPGDAKRADDFDARVLPSSAEPGFDPGFDSGFDRVDVIALDLGADLARGHLAELSEFVAEGGGLLATCTGWGWQQLNTDKVLARDLPGNLLLQPMGLAFGKHQSSQEAGQFPAGPDRFGGPLAHAGQAFEALGANDVSKAQRAAAIARVRAAMDSLHDHEPLLMVPVRNLIEGLSEDPHHLGPELGRDYEARDLRPLAERWDPWLAIGPFPGKGRVDARGPLDGRERRFVPDGPGPDRGKRWRGTDTKLRWRELEVDAGGRAMDVGTVRLDLALSGAELERGTAYLSRRVTLSQPVSYALRADTSGGVKLWLDGELLLDRKDSGAPGDDRIDLVLQLEPGTHYLFAKLAHDGGVWNFALSPLADPLEAGAVDAAVRRGIEYLARHQLLDGSFSGYTNYGPGLTAFALYAMLKSGVPRDDPLVQRSWSYIQAHRAEFTYSLSAKILAAFAYERGEPTAAMRNMVERMVAFQEPSGLYAYPVHPDGQRLADDLSTTLYGALALRVADERGLRIPDSVWSGLIEGTLRCWRGEPKDNPRNGFSYHPREVNSGAKATGSMTGAGLTVLSIAREGLGGKLDRSLAAEFEAALEGGRGWLEDRLVFDRNPGHHSHHMFHVYGVERTGELLGSETLGGVHWYNQGARYLIERQEPNGSWKATDHSQDVLDTSLALLFLNRATRPSSGSKPWAAAAIASAEAADKATLSCTGRGPFELWIAGVGKAARDAHGWGARKELRIRQVRYLAKPEGGGTEVELTRVTPRAGAAVQRFETRVALPAAGSWDVRAQLELERPVPDGAEPGTALLESEPVRLLFDGETDAEVLAYAEQGARNLLREAAVSSEASSQGSSAPSAAIDGRQDTFWECSADDPERRLTLALDRGVSASRLLLSHAAPHRSDPGRARPAGVDVWINGEAFGSFPLEPDPRRKTELDLGRPLRITRLELRLQPPRDAAGAELAGRPLGLAEIEILD